MHNTELPLPKSRLRVQGGTFIRFAKDGRAIAELPLHEVEEVQMHRPFDPMTITIGAVAWIFGAAAFFYAEAEGIRWSVAAFGAFIGLMCMIAQRKNQIRIATRGEELHFDFADTLEDANAFIFSLRLRIRESEANPSVPGTVTARDESQVTPD